MRGKRVIAGLLGAVCSSAAGAVEPAQLDPATEARPTATVAEESERHSRLVPRHLSTASWEDLARATYAESLVFDLGELAGPSLVRMLDCLPCFKRTEVVATWALSSSRELRLAVALASDHGLSALGVSSALMVLEDDADPDIRRCARHATDYRAWGHAAESQHA